MIEVRLAKEGEIVSQKELWKLCFGDQDRYIDFYFTNRYKEEETLLLLHNNKIISMLTMIAVRTVFPDNQSFASAMLYAIATHPEYQNRGLATQLMDSCHKYLAINDKVFSMVVPAQQDLINFYHRQGYREGFYLREVVFSRDRINSMKVSSSPYCSVFPVEAQAYNAIRGELLQGKFYIGYEDSEIEYQKKLSQQSETDIYGIDIDGIRGCAVAERITSTKVLIKEILIPEEFIPQVIKQIAHLIPAEEYILRTPAYLGENLRGRIRPFGMIKAHGKFELEITTEDRGYLGIALD